MDMNKEVFGSLNATEISNTLKYITNISIAINEIIDSRQNIDKNILENILSKNNINIEDINKNKNIIENIKNIVINIEEASVLINSYLKYQNLAIKDSIENKKITKENNKLEKSNNNVNNNVNNVNSTSNTNNNVNNVNNVNKTISINKKDMLDIDINANNVNNVNNVNNISNISNDITNDISIKTTKTSRSKKSSTTKDNNYTFDALESCRSKNKTNEILTLVIKNGDLDKFITIDKNEYIDDLYDKDSSLYKKFNEYLKNSILSKKLILCNSNNIRFTEDINILTGVNIYCYQGIKVNSSKLKELKKNSIIELEDTWINFILHNPADILNSSNNIKENNEDKKDIDVNNENENFSYDAIDEVKVNLTNFDDF